MITRHDIEGMQDELDLGDVANYKPLADELERIREGEVLIESTKEGFWNIAMSIFDNALSEAQGIERLGNLAYHTCREIRDILTK